MRPSRGVQPDIAALGQKPGHGEAVVFHKEDLAEETLVAGHADYILHDVDARLVGRMRFAGKDKGDGTVGIVDDPGQLVRIGKEQGRAFVGRETARKANQQGIGLKHAFHAVALVPGQVEFLGEQRHAGAQGVKQFLFLGHARGPVCVVRNFVNPVPDRIFRRCLEPAFAKVLVEQLVHLRADV